MWPRGAETDQQPACVLSEARAPRGERVRRHPAEVRADAAADHERGEYRPPGFRTIRIQQRNIIGRSR